jgi:hypothetical protein
VRGGRLPPVPRLAFLLGSFLEFLNFFGPFLEVKFAAFFGPFFGVFSGTFFGIFLPTFGPFYAIYLALFGAPFIVRDPAKVNFRRFRSLFGRAYWSFMCD